MDDHVPPRSTRTPAAVLRGATPWALPLVLVAVVGWVMALLAVLWTAQPGATDRSSGIALALVTAGVGALGAVLRRGCRVRIEDGAVQDQLAYRTVHHVPQARIRAAHVSTGAWRWFVLELDDGSTVTLVGTGPLQFPAHLLDRSHRSDHAQIDLLMGPDRPGDS